MGVAQFLQTQRQAPTSSCQLRDAMEDSRIPLLAYTKTAKSSLHASALQATADSLGKYVPSPPPLHTEVYLAKAVLHCPVPSGMAVLYQHSDQSPALEANHPNICLNGRDLITPGIIVGRF
ncbi:hypothetical protein MN608_11055 [Microdochium nivale]|nr:hypothetical protein MN608_11055 [Microdochium nivale]